MQKKWTSSFFGTRIQANRAGSKCIALSILQTFGRMTMTVMILKILLCHFVGQYGPICSCILTKMLNDQPCVPRFDQPCVTLFWSIVVCASTDWRKKSVWIHIIWADVSITWIHVNGCFPILAGLVARFITQLPSIELLHLIGTPKSSKIPWPGKTLETWQDHSTNGWSKGACPKALMPQVFTIHRPKKLGFLKPGNRFRLSKMLSLPFGGEEFRKAHELGLGV